MQPSPIPFPAPTSNSTRREARSEAHTESKTAFADRLSQDRTEHTTSEKPASSAPSESKKSTASERSDAHATVDAKAPESNEASLPKDAPSSIPTVAIVPDPTLEVSLSDLRNPDGSPVLDPSDPELDPLLAALASILNALPTAPTAAIPSTTADDSGLSVEPLALNQTSNTQTDLTLLAQVSSGETDAGQTQIEPTAALPALKATGNHGQQPAHATSATTDLTSTNAGSDLNALSAQSLAAGEQQDQQEQANQEQFDRRTNNGAIALTGMKPTDGDDSSSKTNLNAPTQTTDISAVSEAKPKATAVRSEAPNPMDRAVANQVTRALVRQAADGSRTISLRLTPPELGTVRIDIVERSGVLTAHLHAEDDAVRVALERSIGQLRQDLRSHDAPIRDVQLGDQWNSDLTRQRQDQQQGRQRARRDGATSFSLDGVTVSATPTAAKTALGGTITNDLVDARA